MSALLEVKDLHAYYGQSHILQGVNLEVGKGEIVSLLGRNGEGKSSLMSLLTGEQTPDSGAIIFDKQLKVGFLPQDLPPADELSVFDVVAQGAPEIAALLHLKCCLLHQNSKKRNTVNSTIGS